MRAARLVPSLTVAVLTLPLLAGCGGSGSSGPTAAGSSTPGSSTPGSSTAGEGAAASSPASSGSAGTTGTAGVAVSCAAAPAALVGAALGDTLSAAQETRNGDTIVVCDYKGPKTGTVKLRIQTDSGAATFAVGQKGFATQSLKTTDEAFADEAYSNVLGSGAYQVTTLVARQGSVEILVAAKATVAQEKGLLSQLFNRL